VLVAKTEAGRATIAVLAINHAAQTAIRNSLLAEGEFPV
jgi:hypothetical protein